MSFKVKYEHLNSMEFMNALSKLAAMPLPIKVSYNISKILDKCEVYMKEGKAMFTALLKKYCEMDEKGNIIPQMTPEVKEGDKVTKPAMPIRGSYIIKEDQQKNFEKDMADFLSIELEIPRYKVNINDLQGEKISAEILSALDSIITDKLEAI